MSIWVHMGWMKVDMLTWFNPFPILYPLQSCRNADREDVVISNQVFGDFVLRTGVQEF